MSDNVGNNAPTKQDKMFILFSVRDDARFLSHRETQTIWQRAFVRAGIPVAYTQGFNPRIKMSLPLPRNVGVASACELLVFNLAESFSAQQIAQSLQGQLPVGIEFISAGLLPEKQKVLPCEVSYCLTACPSIDIVRLREQVESLNAQEQSLASRTQRGRHKARCLNIKDNIKQLVYRENNIELTMNISQGVTARLDEIVHALGLEIVTDITYILRTDTRYEGIINDILSQRMH